MPLHRTRGLRLGARALGNVDRVAVRHWWDSLEVDEQLRVLRFEDPKLARRLYFIRAELLRSDLACYQHGIFARNLRGQASMALVLDAFEFDIDVSGEGAQEPVAFITKLIFVNRENFFDLLEEELDGFLADGRPALRRSQWLNLFDVSPSSWLEFLRQLLRMIELAVLEAFQQHQEQQCAPTAELLQPECEAEHAGDDNIIAACSAPDSRGQPARRNKARKLRKKEAAISAAATREAPTAADLAVHSSRQPRCSPSDTDTLPPTSDGTKSCSSDAAPQDCGSDSCGDSTRADQLELSAETSFDSTTTSGADSQVLSKSSSMGSMPSLSSCDDVSPAEGEAPDEGNASAHVEQTSGHAYAALFGPPPTILVPAFGNHLAGDAQVTCSAWVCNEQIGASAEWHWVAFEQRSSSVATQADSVPERRLCAHVRNTFLELSSPSAVRNLHRRARSADIAMDAHRWNC